MANSEYGRTKAEKADLVLHLSNDNMEPGRENTARFMDGMLNVALNTAGSEDLTGPEFSELILAQVALLRMPPVVWGVGDTLSAKKPRDAVRHWLLLPTNTALDTSSQLVNAAKERFNPVHFEELKAKTPARLGSVLTSIRGGSSMDGLLHLVCREAGKPKLRALNQCFQNLPSLPGVQYVLPIWQAEANFRLWIEVIAGWVRDTWYAGQKSRQPLVIRFAKQERHLGIRLETELVLHGVLVGREGESGQSLSQIDPKDPLHRRLAALVGLDELLTPEIYASWVQSGVQMSLDAWNRHAAILTKEHEALG